jgi:hypothetical protein
VACDTLWLVKLIVLTLISIFVLVDYFVFLFISYVYEMKYVVVPLYPCYIDVILCIFTICHNILALDYTHPFRHPLHSSF